MNNQLTLEELIENVRTWGLERDLESQLPEKQFTKVIEEIGELAEGLSKNKTNLIIDALGDVLVTLIILNMQLIEQGTLDHDQDLKHCLQVAYNEIKDRKGKTINGVFIKQDDLKQ